MSERRGERRIERCAGFGTVTRDGAAIGSVSYVMEIWETFRISRAFAPGADREIVDAKQINITFINHQLDTFRLCQERATLTLHLQDGRQLDGFLDGDSFVASGQLTAL